MSTNRMLHLAVNARSKAQMYLIKKKPGRAFAQCLIAFRSNPSLLREQDEVEVFLAALCQWSNALETQDRYKDLFQCYEQALAIFPDHEEILNNLGAHLFRLNHIKEACHFFRKALNASPYFLPARRNLENASNLIVERWHFRMLNDQKRHEAFRKAIGLRVSQGFNTVLDIGTGTGILSLLAVEAGAVKVYACDRSSEMIEVATEVMKSNNTADKVTLINKMSTDLTVPGDLPKRVGLVVTEIFDAGVFGENVLETVFHAWSHLLLEPEPNLKYQKPLSGEQGINYGAVIPQGFTLWLAAIECDYINKKNFHKRSDETFYFMDLPKDVFGEVHEPYDTESLSNVPGGFKLLTRPRKVLSLNLNNPRKVHGYLVGDLRIPDVLPQFIRAGRMDAIAVWFQLTMDGGTVMISTSPEGETCWDQAIFPVPYTVKAKPGLDIALDISCKGGKLAVGYDFPSILEPCESVDAPHETVRFLNDTIHLCSLKEVAEHFSRRILSRILDFSLIPVLGLKLFKTSVVRELTCIVRSEKHKTTVEDITSTNHVVGENIQILAEDELDEEKVYDLIITDLVDPCGELQEKAMCQLPLLRQLLRSNSGVLLPNKLIVKCELIESDWLAEVSGVVSDDRTCGFQISEHINLYQVSQHLDFYLPSIKHTVHSEQIKVLTFNVLETLDQTVSRVQTKITHSGVINAIPYWFEICWLEGSDPVSTMHERSHINQAAFLVRPALKVISGEVVTVVTRYYKGILSIYIETHGESV